MTGTGLRTQNPYSELESFAVDVIGNLDHAVQKAQSLGRPLRVKMGFDPTAPDIHLGHTVGLALARQFQDRGATVVMIIGDFTARVGDPTGKSKTRPMLTREEIEKNAQTYLEQAVKVLDPTRLEVRRNSEWLDKMDATDFMNLLRDATVAQMLTRDDFANRYAKGNAISLLEFVYPLLQGKDSEIIDADIELGGTEQLYNLMVGRKMNSQVCMTVPILTGIDGTKRMGKSLGNYVGITQEPAEMFGRMMSLPDHALPEWLCLLDPTPEGRGLAWDVASGKAHPMHAKRKLAKDVISKFHSPQDAAHAEEEFDRKHKRNQAPQEMPLVKTQGKVFLPELMMDQFFGLKSRAEARRLIQGKAVKLDGEVVQDLEFDSSLLAGKTLQAGKRRWLRFE